jgi:hypothetical protein
MSDKKDSYSARRVPFITIQWPGYGESMSEDKWKGGCEWHLEFNYAPEFPYPFPIVPEGTRTKHDPLGHLSHDGTVHVFNTGIIEKLVRAGLRMRRATSEPFLQGRWGWRSHFCDGRSRTCSIWSK